MPLEVRNVGSATSSTSASASAKASASARVGASVANARSSKTQPTSSFEAMLRERASRYESASSLMPKPGSRLGATSAMGSELSIVKTRSALPPESLPKTNSRTIGTTPNVEPSQATARPTSATALKLADFPRPPGDNGRGIHWIPTTHSTDAVVDRFVDEAATMKMKWVVLLNDGTNVGENDYLVKKLVEKGIEPVMRVYTEPGKTIEGDLGAMVRHYKTLGVDYFQLYNEPNLTFENAGAHPDPERYVDAWIPAAKIVSENGGYPGFGALSPGGNFDDIEFLKRSLDSIVSRGETKTLDRAWISLHNYTLNHPIDYTKDSNGFLKFRFYDEIIRQKLGRSMPIIGTEGGTFVGSAEDTTFPAVDDSKMVDMVVDSYSYMSRGAEPYFFAHSYWVIANEEGGGHDQGFSRHALFAPGKTNPVVGALRRMG